MSLDAAMPRTTAPALAAAQAMPFAKADLSIDAVPTAVEIDRALAKLESLAKERGSAVGVAAALLVVQAWVVAEAVSARELAWWLLIVVALRALLAGVVELAGRLPGPDAANDDGDVASGDARSLRRCVTSVTQRRRAPSRRPPRSLAL